MTIEHIKIDDLSSDGGEMLDAAGYWMARDHPDVQGGSVEYWVRLAAKIAEVAAQACNITEWVPVGQKLPKNDQLVLALEDGLSVVLTVFDRGQFYDIHHRPEIRTLRKVSHWAGVPPRPTSHGPEAN